MVAKFRRILVHCGRTIPYVLLCVVLINHIETTCAIALNDIAIDSTGSTIYNVPISQWVGEVIYIDWLDVVLLYLLAISMCYCKATFYALHMITISVALRYIVEHFTFATTTIVVLCTFMSTLCILSLINGVKSSYFNANGENDKLFNKII